MNIQTRWQLLAELETLQARRAAMSEATPEARVSALELEIQIDRLRGDLAALEAGPPRIRWR